MAKITKEENAASKAASQLAFDGDKSASSRQIDKAVATAQVAVAPNANIDVAQTHLGSRTLAGTDLKETVDPLDGSPIKPDDTPLDQPHLDRPSAAIAGEPAATQADNTRAAFIDAGEEKGSAAFAVADPTTHPSEAEAAQLNLTPVSRRGPAPATATAAQPAIASTPAAATPEAPADESATRATVAAPQQSSPVITSGTTASFAENASGAVYTATANDVDAGTTLTYALSGADAALFDIDAATGVVTFKTSPDYEAPGDAGGNNIYDVVVSASDGTNTTSQAVVISVANANEGPVITSGTSASFAENANGVVYTATATDVDAGTTLTYALSGADAALFDIDAATGVVTFKTSPDYEAPGDAGGNNIYDVIVSVSDGTNTTSQAVAISVSNANEGPVITSGTTASFAENASGVVYTATATDVDAGTTLTYALSGTDAALFDIDAATGVVTFKAAPDYEAPGDAGGDNIYDVVVSVSDGTSTTSQAVAISVANANEGPVITSGTSASFAEDASGAIYTATATDVDAGTTLTYALSGAGAALFDIDAATGVVTFKTSPDYEAPGDAGGDNIYDVIVSASDGTNTNSQAVAISVSNANEGPVITSGTTASFAENASGAVYTATATDVDAGTTLTYALSGADAALFDIDAATGVVTFKASPDYEAPRDAGGDNIYDVVVSASDGTNTTSQAVAISVANANEGPVITSGTSASFAENASGAVYTATANDVDAGTTLTFALSGTDAALFDIDAATGVVTFKTSPDYEAPGDAGGNNIYDVIVSVSDGTNTTSQNVAISVTNANEGPVITSGTTASFAENASGAVYTATATDVDAGTTLTYALSGADAALFDIDAATGVVTFKAAPDYEAPGDAGGNNIYDVVVSASDGTNTTSQSVAISVANANEAPTSAYFQSGGFAVENAVTGAVVGVVAAVDPDTLSGDQFTFALVDDAGGRFAIDTTTGQITVANGTLLDFEAAPVHQISVSVTDAAGSAVVQPLTIGVIDTNETPVILSPAIASVAENSTTAYTASATDQDVGSTINYTLGGVDAQRFIINAATGMVMFKAAPDYEAPTDSGGNNVYDITIGASDGTNLRTQAVAITVTNVNEAAIFGSGTSASFTENGTGVAYLASVAAADAGTLLAYSLSGADSALFNIDSATGAVTFKSSPNFEIPADAGGDNVYDVTVSASDGTNTTSQNVAISVTDTNEAPIITSGTTATVAENASGTVYTASAVDVDAGATISYALSGTDAALFNINAATGAVTFKNAPNYEAPADAGADNVYNVNVTASDGTLSAIQAVAISVTNINEALVITSGSTQSLTVNENQTAVTTIVGSDPDAGTTLAYSIVGGADRYHFSINSSTGVLTFIGNRDAELPGDANRDGTYDVQVQASDGALASTQMLNVTVASINEAPTNIWAGARTAVAIINPGFEADSLADNSWTNEAIIGWMGVSPALHSLGVQNMTPAELASDARIGSNLAYLQNGGTSISQTLSEVLAFGTTYELSVDVGNRQDSASFAYGTIALYAGSTLLASQPIAAPPEGGWTTQRLEFDSASLGSNSLLLGQALQIRFTNTIGSQINLDNVTLDRIADPTITENSAAGTVVTILGGSDPEGDALTYAIVDASGTAVTDSYFAISGNQLVVKAGAAIDFETAPTRSLYIQATDAAGLSYREQLTVIIGDQAENLVLTSGDDVFTDTGVRELSVDGGAGNDSITGTSGNDVLAGGSGTDTAIFANNAAAYSFALDANDNVVITDLPASGSTGTDRLTGIETLQFADRSVSLIAGTNAGGTIAGTTGADVQVGGSGVNGFSGSEGSDTLVGGDYDFASYIGSTAAVSVDLATGIASGGFAQGDVLLNFEQVDGSMFADALTTSATGSVLKGYFGNDVLVGGAGIDVLLGDQDWLIDIGGDDSISGNGGDDIITGGAGNDLIDGGTGIDTATYWNPASNYAFSLNAFNRVVVTDLVTSDGVDTLTEVEHLRFTDGTFALLHGTNANSAISGTGGADIQVGGAGQDTLSAGDGADILVGGGGADTLDGGAGTDTAVYSGNRSDYTISYNSGTATYTIADNRSSLPEGTDTVTGIENFQFADRMITVTTPSDLLNDAPVFTSGTTATFAENATGTVYTAAATDPEGATPSYSLSGTDAALFDIDAATGAVTFKTAPNYETPTDTGANNVYDVIVSASDGTNTTAQGVAISVSDVEEHIVLTVGNDAFTDTEITELSVSGDSGDDTIIGTSGNDALYGNAGNDALIGGLGDDSFEGGAGDDRIQGDGGIDTASYAGSFSGVTVNLATNVNVGGDAGNDTLLGIENVSGSAFDDSLTGDEGANVLSGSSGNDTLIGGAGDDNLSGTSGDELLDGGTGADTISGGSGIDTVTYAGSSAAVTLNLGTSSASGGDAQGDVVNSVENIIGSNHNDSLTGNSTANMLSGGLGNDFLNGGSGNDTLTGGAGNDTLQGGSNTDTAVFSGNWANYTISYNGSTTAYTLIDTRSGAPDGTDTVTGVETFQFADRTITVTTPSDLLNDAPVFTSGATASFAENGTGTVYTAAATDPDGTTLSYSLSGTDAALFNINSASGAVTFITAPNFEAPTDAGANNVYDVTVRASDGVNISSRSVAISVTDTAENLVLTSGNDSVTDSSVTELSIDGGAGNDLITGGSGNDVIIGGAGADTLNGSGGTDTLSYATTTGNVTVSLASNSASGSDATGDVISNFENVTGGSGNDSLTGDGNVNVLIGGLGNDTLSGGDGSDIFLFGASEGNDVVDGGTGGSWIDAIELSSAGAPGGAGSWYIEDSGGTVYTSGAASGTLNLGSDRSGVIHFADGHTIAFSALEQVSWS